MTITPRMFASIPRLHVNFDGSKTRCLMNIVDMIAVCTKMKEFSHADRTLISNNFSSPGGRMRAPRISWGSHVGYRCLYCLYLYGLLYVGNLACSDDFSFELRSVHSVINDTSLLWGHCCLLWLLLSSMNWNSLNSSNSLRKNSLWWIPCDGYILYWSCTLGNWSNSSNVMYLNGIKSIINAN